METTKEILNKVHSNGRTTQQKLDWFNHPLNKRPRMNAKLLFKLIESMGFEISTNESHATTGAKMRNGVFVDESRCQTIKRINILKGGEIVKTINNFSGTMERHLVDFVQERI